MSCMGEVYASRRCFVAPAFAPHRSAGGSPAGPPPARRRVNCWTASEPLAVQPSSRRRYVLAERHRFFDFFADFFGAVFFEAAFVFFFAEAFFDVFFADAFFA